MTQTVTALYDTYDSAVSAVNALEASGSRTPTSVSFRITSTTDIRKDRPTNAAEDAGKGAGVGAAVGGVGGLLTGLGLLAIPGVGPVVAAGWLVATAAVRRQGRSWVVPQVGLWARLRAQAYPNATPIFTPKVCGAAVPLSQPEPMTPVHRQLGKFCNAISRWTRPFEARHTGIAAGLPSTKTRRLTPPTKSRRSGHAISAAASSCLSPRLGLKFRSGDLGISVVAGDADKPLRERTRALT